VDQGTPVRLRDIASVSAGYKEREAIIRMDGREAIELAVYKEGDANTVAAAEGVRLQLERLKENLPPDTKLITVDDQSVFIQESLDEVKSAALLGGLLSILIIFFFLRDHRPVLLHGPGRSEPERHVPGRSGTRHRHGGG
jgi:HAE1 family hydrophobic/amphiphilic exporter-1